MGFTPHHHDVGILRASLGAASTEDWLTFYENELSLLPVIEVSLLLLLLFPWDFVFMSPRNVERREKLLSDLKNPW